MIPWSTSPSRRPHPTLGVRLRWWRKDKLARVERFTEGSGKYVGLVGPDWRIVNERGFGTLKAAQRACDKALRN
jgi:hypothetical protein